MMEPAGGMQRPTGVLTRLRRPAAPLITAVVIGGGVLVASLIVGAAPSAAQQDGAEGVQVEVVAGYDGRYLVGRRLPVTVSIEADRLVRGAVEVAIDGLAGTWSVPVEVPGGSDKQVVVVIPSSAGFPVDAVQVRLVGSGEAITVEAELEPLQAEEVVGLLPGATPADLPPPLPFPQGIGTARFAALSPELLAIPGAIDPVGTIVAGPEELGRLDAAARASVLDWIDRGGRLVVDAAPGTPIAGLPEAWQPGAGSRAAAGLGEVRLSAGRAAAGAWSEVLEPTPTVSLAELQSFGIGMVGGMELIGDSLARDAGLNALDLPWLLGFLAVYVALAGPVGYLLLRRRRPSLGWIAIPVLAAIFTAGAWVVGSDLRSGTTAAHGTVLETSPAGTRATTVVGTVSRSGGDGGASFPAGWTASSVDNSQFGFGPGNGGGIADVAVTAGQDGSEATIPLAAGDFGVVRGTGPLDDTASGLTVEAASVGGGVSGSVTNTNDFTVESTGVFLGRAAERLGDLDPGETVEFQFEGNEFGLRDPFFPAEAEVWPQESGFGDGSFQPGSVVNLALLSEALMPLGPNGRPRGVVTVIGWTRDVRSPVDVSGGEPSGRSAVIARANVTAGADGLARGAAHREVLRGPDGIELPDDDRIDAPVQGLVWRFAVPPGTGPQPLTLVLPAYVPRIDVWDGTTWQTVDETPFNFAGDVFRLRSVALPAGGRLGDTVLLRGYVMTDFGPVSGDGVDLFTEVAA
jgi:hypothetical protein